MVAPILLVIVTQAPGVQVVDATFRDGSRYKTIPLRIAYPVQRQAHPVVIFSHGAGGNNAYAATLTDFWASKGYVVISPNHADADKLRSKPQQKTPKLPSFEELTGGFQEWHNRITDVTVLLDALATLDRLVPALRGRMDVDRVAVAGHSFGAYTAQVAAGATIERSQGAGLVSYRHPAVRAAVLLSPQGSGQMGLTRDSWNSFRVPMLAVTGTLDRGARGQSPDWRKEGFLRSPEGDKWFALFEGAGHMSFIGRVPGAGRDPASALNSPRFAGLSDERRQRLAERLRGPKTTRSASASTVPGDTRLVTLAFLDAMLKGDLTARKKLDGGASSLQLRSKVRIDKR